MALSQYQQGNPSGSGDFIGRIEYNAKAGRLYRPDRTQGPNGYETVKTELPMPIGFAMDMAGVEVGWALFEPGAMPNLVFVPLADCMSDATKYPARPSDKRKEGFGFAFGTLEVLGNELREFSSTARAVREQFDFLHDDYTAGRDDNPGKAPWVVFSGVAPVTGQHGTNYTPTLQITDWVDASVFHRATEAPPIAATPPAVQAAPPPAQPQAAVAAPPPPPAPPQPPAAGAPEFGPRRHNRASAPFPCSAAVRSVLRLLPRRHAD